MACIIDNGYTMNCNSIGGVSKVYIGTYDQAAAWTLDVDNKVTAVTIANSMYNFEQDIEFAGLEQTGTYSRENGTVFYESKLSVKFIELDNDLRNTVLALGKAPIYAVIISNAGHAYILGVESAGRATEGTASLGVAQGDMNGATLSFTFKSPNGAFMTDSVDETALGLLGFTIV
jgi:hypothetical protein